MSKITKLDKKALQALREPIEAELKALGERLGLAFSIGNGSFGDGAEAHFKLIMKVDDPAIKAAADKAAWDRNCHWIGVDYSRPDESGLRPEDFGTEFEYSAYRCRTVGIEARRSKFPIKCEVLTGIHKGQIRLLPDTAAAKIRAATDAKAKPPTKAKAKAAA